ncbi:hypothetical protein E2C01_054596 [Portunus trituberculatus]|uniref:Uncharacterized protein n=1 Tax=Portunus trituberculatus TaxID=210409 RepID=A0A5B7GTM6_PORTR|nr:hypothetical protein [Portunus trituberculatus]
MFCNASLTGWRELVGIPGLEATEHMPNGPHQLFRIEKMIRKLTDPAGIPQNARLLTFLRFLNGTEKT